MPVAMYDASVWGTFNLLGEINAGQVLISLSERSESDAPLLQVERFLCAWSYLDNGLESVCLDHEYNFVIGFVVGEDESSRHVLRELNVVGLEHAGFELCVVLGVVAVLFLVGFNLWGGIDFLPDLRSALPQLVGVNRIPVLRFVVDRNISCRLVHFHQWPSIAGWSLLPSTPLETNEQQSTDEEVFHEYLTLMSLYGRTDRFIVCNCHGTAKLTHGRLGKHKHPHCMVSNQ